MEGDWLKMGDLFSRVLDAFGVLYRRGPLTCDSGSRSCGESFSFRVDKAYLNLRDVHGTVDGPLEVYLHVVPADNGGVVFRIYGIGDLHVKIPFRTFVVNDTGFGFEGLEGSVFFEHSFHSDLELALIYLVYRLDEAVESRDKLLRLMFLVNYIDPDTGSLRTEPRLGVDFYLYDDGFSSMEVLKKIEELERMGIFSYDVGFHYYYRDLVPELPEDLKKAVDFVVEIYGDFTAEELDKSIIALSGLPEDKSRWDSYRGFALSDILSGDFGGDRGGDKS